MTQHTEPINIAIQCKDERTGEKGTFGYYKTPIKNKFYSVTPVFPSLVELLDYMRENGIKENVSALKQEYLNACKEAKRISVFNK